MPFALPPLPYPADALEPHVSANTFSFHHGKHHAAYVNNLNNLLKDSPLKDAPLEDVIVDAKKNNKVGVFNNAAQHFNHSFFWHSMKPKGGEVPKDTPLGKQIVADFGSVDKMLEDFKTTAATHFGSGWAWLVLDGENKLKVFGSHDADTPLVHGLKPLLTLDVWEHAYYLDYQNRRPDFISAFLGHLANWDFAEANYAKAISASKL